MPPPARHIHSAMGKRTSLPKFNYGAHFLTTKTFRNAPCLGHPACARMFCEELEAARTKYGFHVLAFVVMPEHIHLLLWWDAGAQPTLTISKVAWAVKGRAARRIVDYWKGVGEGIALPYPGDSPRYAIPEPLRQPQERPHRRNWRYKIWQKGAGYDFNIYTERKLREKIRYIHANPLRAGLSETPEAYPWSSAANCAGAPPAHPVRVSIRFP